jgi:hypothetical protein
MASGELALLAFGLAADSVGTVLQPVEERLEPEREAVIGGGTVLGRG